MLKTSKHDTKVLLTRDPVMKVRPIKDIKFNVLRLPVVKYRNNHKYWKGQASANNVDPDQASDLGQHCLPLIQQYFGHINR